MESAAARSDIQDTIVALEVLVFKVEKNMPANGGLGSGVVVISMVGTEAHAAISDVDITIGDEEITFLLLRAAGRKFRDTTGSSWQADLLSETRSEGSEKGKKEKIGEAPGGRGGDWRMDDHAAIELKESQS